MNDKGQVEKTAKAASKSFMTVGPTLHYSHRNVQRCWLLALAAFVVSCFFWSKILTGVFWSCSLESLSSPELWHLGRLISNGVSIYEYAWQIQVLGLLMGILGIVPVLISQLLSFRYSILFIAAVAFLANLAGFAICLLLSCIAVACRPLRFRSRFIAVALCTAPQLLYWGYFGGARGLEPLKFGFSFTPWICAWLVGLALAGLVLGIGHFTRYRPGLVWIFTCGVLAAAIALFDVKIGFDELDYQLYVTRNNPEQVSEFYDHSITESLDRTIENREVKRYLADFFYPKETILLRAALKREIRDRLAQDRWPNWFMVPEELDYQTKKQWLFEQYDRFIRLRSDSRRMPIALYYKGLLSEYSPDIESVEQREMLHFYSDYPYERSRQIWYRLYRAFGESPESLEARWRIAMHYAGQGRFAQAENLLVEAQATAAEQVKTLEEQQGQNDTFFGPFRPPAETVMTTFKLSELQRRLQQLRNLISKENRTEEPESSERLARFVMLNAHSQHYLWHLDELLEQMGKKDGLRDNVLLARAKLTVDEQARIEELNELYKTFKDTDGGIEALYELALLKIYLWREQGESNSEQKKKYLTEARETLTNFIKLYPDSIFGEQAQKNLADLPSVE